MKLVILNFMFSKCLIDMQEDKEIWEPMLPRNYKEIIDISETPGIYSNTKKKDLYKMLSEGIFLLQGKVVINSFSDLINLSNLAFYTFSVRTLQSK